MAKERGLFALQFPIQVHEVFKQVRNNDGNLRRFSEFLSIRFLEKVLTERRDLFRLVKKINEEMEENMGSIKNQEFQNNNYSFETI